MANWEKKSSYLLREIVKFRTYIDCLTAAQSQKEKIYTEREEYEKEKALLKQCNTGDEDANEGGEELKMETQQQIMVAAS